MSYLLDEVPQVNLFFDEVLNNVAHYRLFPEERFESFLRGVATTTEVDSQGDQLTLGTIIKMARQINSQLIWNRAEHDPLIQPIGRLIAARVFYAPESDVHFVAVVSGIYDIAHLPRFADLGISMENLVSSASRTGEYQPGVAQAQLAIGLTDLDQDTLHRLLSERPRLLNEKTSDRTRKATDPLTIIEIAISAWLLTSNPFSHAFLSKFGEKAAEEVIEFYGWVKEKVVQAIQQHRSKRVLLEIATEHALCKIKFVIDSKEPDILLLALDSLNDAAGSALVLVDRMVEMEPDNLVYEFDRKTKAWLPLYATTKKCGVITDRPYLITLDRFNSLSIAATVTRQRLIQIIAPGVGESVNQTAGTGSSDTTYYGDT